jgi:ABC-type lipoprotein export system ATPase subunit
MQQFQPVSFVIRPGGSLDPNSADSVMALLRQIARSHGCFRLHSPDLHSGGNAEYNMEVRKGRSTRTSAFSHSQDPTATSARGTI